MDHPEVFQKFLIVIGQVLVRGFGARKLRLPSPAGYSPRAQDRRLRRRQVHRDAIHVPEVRTVDVFGFDACALVQRHLENGSRTIVSGYLSCNAHRSEEHTSELQSLMRSSYAVFCLKKKKGSHTIKILEQKGTLRTGEYTCKPKYVHDK